MRRLFIVLLLFGSLAQASSFRCFEQVAYAKPRVYEFELEKSERVLFSSENGMRVYLAEKASDIFELEAFVAEKEIRIYSKALLREATDSLELTYWSRDQLLAWSCLRALP